MFKKVSYYIDLSFLIRFFLSFVPFFYFNLFYLGITDPKNYYIPFLDHNLNYIKWVTFSINYIAGLITNVVGIDPIIDGKLIFVKNGPGVLLEYACLGFGIISFWVAFIIAHRTSWKYKLYWSLGGIMAIWFLNCMRIAILLIALENNWKGNPYFDHHDMFNLFSYVIICMFIYWFYSNSKKHEQVGVLNL
jgi:exosortase/archaeosortase family protein